MIKIDDARTFLYEIQKTKTGESFGKPQSDERKNVLDLKILVCVDVSGSIGEGQFKQFMQQIDLIRGLSVVKVLETDSRVIALYDYFKTNQRQVMRLQGGGGTEFSEAFEVAKKMNPDAILFMTDGHVWGSQVKNPGIPTGWILTHDGVKPYGFGDVIVKLPPPRS